MFAYATVNDVQARMLRTMSDAEKNICAALLEDAATIIDSTKTEAPLDVKLVVSYRMVIRAIGDGGGNGVPIGATQGSQAALGYSQSWTISNGSSGELYISKAEKNMLGIGNKIGAYSPIERCAEVADID